ncbi:MAG: aspartate-semialdehyde dehydrogenase [Erythrobacter sp.]|nr:aspartate-semialdehyde dehydrogenase [Erythrobacter sp.]
MGRTGLGSLFLAGALALAACGSDIPSPAEQLQAEGQAEPVREDAVVLKGDGLAAGAEAFLFAAGRSEVEYALERVLGEPSGRLSNDECGAGPMNFTNFDGGLTVNFQDGRLVGWYFDEPNAAISTATGLTVGTARDEVMATRGFSALEESTLGEEFAVGDQLGGFLDDDAVSGLYAGTNCFFR